MTIRAGDRKGLVLVAVLWVAVVLMIIALATGRKSRLDSKVSLTETERLRCKWACRAGLEKAIGVLSEDPCTADSLTDLWSDNEEDFNDVELNGCVFKVKVIDEASKLNVNLATKEQLMGLDNMTEEIADTIIDWRDKDSNPGAAGAEMAYYQNLPYPYVIRNGPFKTMRELLKVKGVTPELLYGEDTNLNGELDFNERDGDESWPPDNGDNKLDQGWIAYLTCYSYDRNVDGLGSRRVDVGRANEGELVRSLQISRGQAKWIVDNRKNGYKSIADLISDGSPKKAEPAKGSPSRGEVKAEPLDMATFSSIADKITVKSGMQQIPGLINVNTASREVLKALLGGDASAEQAADRVVTYRNSVTGGMTSIADVLKVEGIKVATFKKIAELITVRSGVYTVRCFATAKRGDARGTNLQAEAVVDRSSKPCKVLHWYQGSGPYFANYRPTGSRG